jgi:hypothetical protein
MSESKKGRTVDPGFCKSTLKSAIVVVLLLTSVAMPCLILLQLEAGSGKLRTSPMVYGLWAALSLWIALDAANFLRVLGLRVDDALAPGALALSGLGVVNLMSVFGALFMMSHP